MASKSKKGKTIDKWRKKRYFPVLAPKIFQERELGKSIAYEPESLHNRSISTNLMILTGNVKKQNINVTFKVDKVRGDTAYTSVDRYAVMPSAIKRKVRRQRNRLDDSFKCVTKDGKLIRIKPMVITHIRTSSTVRTDLRNLFIQQIAELISNKDVDSIVMDLVNEKLQKEVRSKLSKVLPTKSVDIRIFKVLGEATSEDKKANKKLLSKKIEIKKEEEPVEDEE